MYLTAMFNLTNHSSITVQCIQFHHFPCFWEMMTNFSHINIFDRNTYFKDIFMMALFHVEQYICTGTNVIPMYYTYNSSLSLKLFILADTFTYE